MTWRSLLWKGHAFGDQETSGSGLVLAQPSRDPNDRYLPFELEVLNQ